MSRSAGADPRHTGRCRFAAVFALAALPFPASAADDVMHDRQVQAQAGDKDASFALGVAYDLGQGAARDSQLACRFYTEAGNRGHVAGAFNAAVMLDSGQCGTARRADLAAVWYGRAAAAGAGRAQYNLALLYSTGDGIPRNPLVAASWFRAAAASGVAAAAGRSDAIRASGGKGPLLPVVPAYPAAAQALPPGNDAATLVWTAPEQPDAVRFFVELYALKPSGPVELLGRYVDLTALRVRLPPDATQFTWRVLTVGAEPPRYAVGPWRDFTAGPPASEQH